MMHGQQNIEKITSPFLVFKGKITPGKPTACQNKETRT
jgi:hypothetical protein